MSQSVSDVYALVDEVLEVMGSKLKTPKYPVAWRICCCGRSVTKLEVICREES